MLFTSIDRFIKARGKIPSFVYAIVASSKAEVVVDPVAKVIVVNRNSVSEPYLRSTCFLVKDYPSEFYIKFDLYNKVRQVPICFLTEDELDVVKRMLKNGTFSVASIMSEPDLTIFVAA